MQASGVKIQMNLKKNLALGITLVIVLSFIMIGRASAEGTELNLPTTWVKIEVFNGTDTYFNTLLSDVPAGSYDVSNGTYDGWCADIAATMSRSPDYHYVKLYSGTNPPPGNLSSERWDMVNYILNHKQGNGTDIQQAIWYFVNMDQNYTPNSEVAMMMVNDALANGNGFFPEGGQIGAVICLPKYDLPGEEVQVSMIEVTYPVVPEFPSFAILSTLMLVTLIIAVYKKCRVPR
jgi:hypothetical protein